jgi:REP element-mobilizing transposase RayT
MAIARSCLLNNEIEGTYHCISRIVRRAFLCGWDEFTQRDYEYRKVWINERLQELAGIFTIDVCGYAVMENHLHVILRNRPDLAAQASDREIALRWWRLFPKRRTFDQKPEEPTDFELDMVLEGLGRVEILRKRLRSISWFMRCLKEYLAKRANAEDQCTGRFWEGRFKSIALLDQSAILTCAAYVDLNPIRAGIAETPETSNFTSAQDRIIARQARKGLTKENTSLKPAEVQWCLNRASWLCPFRDEPNRRGFLDIDLDEYLALLDWTGREVVEGKKGSIPDHLAPILQRLDIEGDQWLHSSQNFGSMFYRVAGKVKKMKERALATGQKWVRGIRAGQTAFLSR